MDKETAKEIEDLQNNLKALVSRKGKREDVALEDENKHLKNENARLMLDNACYINHNSQSIQKLANLRQSNGELKTDNKRLKNEMEQHILSKTFLQQSHDKEAATQAKTIKTHVSETRQLNLKINNLQAEINELQKHKVASKKVVSDLKTKRRLEMEAEFKLLVSH